MDCHPRNTGRGTFNDRSEDKLAVGDVLGCKVRVPLIDKKGAGYDEVRFDGSGLASGVYLYRLQAGQYVATKKLHLMK